MQAVQISGTLDSIAVNAAATVAVAGAIVMSAALVSQRFGRVIAPSFWFNAAYSAIALTMNVLAKPLAAGLAAFAVGAIGGGLISLPSHGWGLVGGAAAFVLLMDFGEYLFHRAQHTVPALWALHSLHHSDRSMNISTTNRHHWADFPIKSVTVYLVVALLVRANPAVIAIYSIASLYNYVSHLNVDFGYGRLSFLLNSPRYHRIHHSRRPEHWNTNFAAIFPIFDVIFGSYRPGAAGAPPPTGLDAREEPKSIGEAVIWPYRRGAGVATQSGGFGGTA
ncbi:MAG TPA: sterol desaturase family protein [Caulobacteraceae bacterium]|jgi:sterol desaturase/sphingolipid hydroxylase (fatty acid hydroxylase superfamily)|nr:sterol desaturase family protein [Caulobacteraceae bacterium]